MNDYLIYAIGFGAQLLFAARLLVQWIKSEKAGRVLSPTLFWQLSLLASFLMLVYGILRDDFVILLGQILSYFVYIRNLQYKNAWRLIPMYFKVVVVIFPFLAAAYLGLSTTHGFFQILKNPEVSLVILLWGSLGQVIFTFRFLYQWYYSEKVNRSVLPMGFWIISICGSVIILSYALYRADPVLFIGQLFGSVVYIRNIYLHSRNTQLTQSRP